jgi:integrase
MVKKNTEGVGREVPVWKRWIDYHKGKSRPTELPKWLDHYFTNNDSFGFSVNHFGKVVKRVAERRGEIIADHHEGMIERQMGNKRRVVPDIKVHDLRATWATQCLRAGIEDEQLMDWAGWKSRDMIDRYRSELNDPSGENTKKYAQGRGSEGMNPGEKLNALRKLGIVDENENLNADELAEATDILS